MRGGLKRLRAKTWYLRGFSLRASCSYVSTGALTGFCAFFQVSAEAQVSLLVKSPLAVAERPLGQGLRVVCEAKISIPAPEGKLYRENEVNL